MRGCARSTRKVSMSFWRSCGRVASTFDAGRSASDALALTTKESRDARQDQAGVLGRDRALLHHDQEQEDDARKDGDQEIRSRRPQARPLQGNQAQVTPVLSWAAVRRGCESKNCSYPQSPGDLRSAHAFGGRYPSRTFLD